MTSQLLELLKQADPVDDEEIRSRPAPREQLAAILSSERPAKRRPRLRAARLIPAAAAGAALIAVVAASLPGSSGTASPEAARALESVARIAAAGPSSPSEDGFTYYKLIEATHGGSDGGSKSGPYGWLLPTTSEQWVAADGSGRIRTVPGEPEFAGPRDERRWRASGSPSLGGHGFSDKRFDPGELDGRPYEGGLPPVRDLPADPERLIEIFEKEAGISSSSVPVNVKSFEYATSVLLQAGSARDLRAALYEAVAAIEGVKLTGNARDPLGRPGTAVAIDSDYSGVPSRYTLVFDPDTSQPLAYTEEWLKPPKCCQGRLIGYSVLQESGHVENVEDRP